MEEKITKPFSPSDVIAALLTFLPEEFSNDPAKIHSTIAQLQKEEKYRYLLEDFEFLNYDPCPYSPLLGRILNRLQESRLLSSINPGYEKYVLNKDSRKAIKVDILDKKLRDQKDNLVQIASKLQEAIR